ncbi:hypothetical protein GCM10027413_14460 [Conyzicola nivalis]|uniref:Coagulation factor 5/8 type domain-containing protein n=1 Tax=Conyzicola nivalis TaxID=1477021 RepID=A0A916SH93_9MICO|nr:coagulation factor 5/8 type domain-containing protein [Conyzicola nivalis]GGA99249.1 hypothetical protein GCM10010979_12160 [Conyzicola nivalis]
MPGEKAFRVLLAALAVGFVVAGIALVLAVGGPRDEPTDTAAPTGGEPDFGPNVTILDPTMTGDEIRSAVDPVFDAQETNQFGERRDAILLKPGSYDATIDVGFYTSVLGLGLSPDDVTVNGQVRVDAQWFDGNATQNFWRSVENLAVAPGADANRWAVAQAAPMRRVHVRGALDLYPSGSGWASGGYIADSKIDGLVSSGSQQQWFSRESEFGGWEGASWNMVFSGVSGAPPQSFPDPPFTVLGATPAAREKPFLYVDDGGDYRVFLPDLRRDSSGASWTGGETAGTSLGIDRFFVARPTDTAAEINAALDRGLNLFLTPGVYRLDETLTVERADTVVLGIGLPTLVPEGGVDAMTVDDVDGVRLAGFLIDAGAENSDVLLRVGGEGSDARHDSNPTTIQDVYFRIGGAGPGRATTSLVVDSADVIIDHIWAWRADHGDGVGWDANTADTGVVVNGANVVATGLFVEHYQRHQLVWNGDNGRTVFFQNEMPYDPPDQDSWRSEGEDGYAAYKVADGVTRHEVWGGGSYCYFNVNPSVRAARAFEAPDVPGVRFHGVLTVSLGGNGSIVNVVNSTGATVSAEWTGPSSVAVYP